MNQRRGVRWSATKAFLRPVMNRSNLTVLTDANVRRILFTELRDEPRATGVNVKIGNHLETFLTSREILLAAGSIGSPQLLQLSGVGARELLRTYDIPMVHELRRVGENLQDHLQIRSIFKVSNTVTLNRRARTWFGKVGMGLEYLAFRSGPLTMPPSQLGAFAKSDPGRNSANIEWHVQPLSLDRFGEPLHRFDAITPSVCNLQPTSRGHVRITNRDPEKHPAITLNYLATKEDCEVAVQGMRFTRRIMADEALARFQPIEWLPGSQITSDDDMLDAARDIGTTIFHPVGTCAMGNTELAVVDDRLRVRGICGLRVIDASVMPTITSGNTNAPTVMIAEQGARFVAETGRREAD